MIAHRLSTIQNAQRILVLTEDWQDVYYVGADILKKRKKKLSKKESYGRMTMRGNRVIRW